MKLYVDDLRRCPDGWKLARTIAQAVSLLYRGSVNEISLDHDICYFRDGDIRMHKETYMPVCLFMCVMPKELRPKKVRIHTANVDAGWKMHDLLRRSGYEEIELIPLGDSVLQEDVRSTRDEMEKS